MTTNAVERACIIHGPAAGVPLALGAGERFIWKATGARTGGALDVGELLVAPGVGPPEHIHHANDETFYVLDGTFRFTVAGQQHVAEAGAFIFIPRGVPHAWQNIGRSRRASC